jgi:hypothetical protein
VYKFAAPAQLRRYALASLMTAKDLLTLMLASYGAIVSTVLGIRAVQRDRRRVKLILEYVTFYNRAHLIIVNVGHRPLTISEIGMQINLKQNGHDYWDSVPRNCLFALRPDGASDPLPVVLDDGQHLSIPLSDYVSDNLYDNNMDARVVVYDVEGNAYEKFTTRLHHAKWGVIGKFFRGSA